MGFALVLCGVACLGWAWGPRRLAPAVPVELRLVLIVLSGILALHVGLSLLALAHVAWSGASVALPLLFSAVVVGMVRRRPAAGLSRASGLGSGLGLGFGDAIAALGLASFAYCAARLWIVTSDFFYHWGVKGEKFFLARGIDAHYLAGPVSTTGWYPNLLPELYASTALARGRFAEREMMAWSVLWLALLWLAVRAALRALPLERLVAQAATGAVLAMCAAAGMSIRLAGGADWILTLALAVGAGALLASPAEDSASSVLAIAAATAAAAKVEGVVLAAILLGLDLARRLLMGPRRRALPAWLRSLWPTALVVGLWAAQNTGAGLWPHGLSALPTAAHAREWLATLPEQLLGGGGMFHLTLLLLLVPLLVWRPPTRWLGIALALQLAFYEAVYLISPGSPEVYVRTSFARLAMQLLPALVVGLVALLADGAAAPVAGDEPATGGRLARNVHNPLGPHDDSRQEINR